MMSSPDPVAAPSTSELLRAADRIVLGRYSPAGVLVNGAMDIIQYRGHTSPYLEPASGDASLNLLTMVPFAVGEALRQALEEAKRHNIPLLPLDEVLKYSDFVSLHVPLTTETRNLIRTETLAKMIPGAILINTSRGEVVNEADLVEALRSKHLAAAGLDVFEHEPLKNHPLQELDNVLLTAHTAGVDFRSREDMVRFAAEGIVKVLAGQPVGERLVTTAST